MYRSQTFETLLGIYTAYAYLNLFLLFGVIIESSAMHTFQHCRKIPQIFVKVKDKKQGQILNICMVNDVPIWVTSPDSLGNVDELDYFEMSLVATHATKYRRLNGILPPGLELNEETGNIHGTVESIEENLASEYFVFTIRASNDYGVADRQFSITVNNIHNDPVWITPAGSLKTIYGFDPVEGDFFSFQLKAEVPGQKYMTKFDMSCGSLPDGLNMTSDGLIRGTITQDNIGSYEFYVSAYSVDEEGNEINSNIATEMFTIEVIDYDDADGLIWVTPRDLGTLVRERYSPFKVEAVSQRNDDITYSLDTTSPTLDSISYSPSLQDVSGSAFGYVPTSEPVFSDDGGLEYKEMLDSSDTWWIKAGHRGKYTFSITVNEKNGFDKRIYVEFRRSKTEPKDLDDGNPIAHTTYVGGSITLNGNVEIIIDEPISTTVTLDDGEYVFFKILVLDDRSDGSVTSLEISGNVKFGDIVFKSIDESFVLPRALSLDSSGIIKGQVNPRIISLSYVFRIKAETEGGVISTKDFSIVVQDRDFINPIVWITPEGNLGEIFELDMSAFKINAENKDNTDITYEVISGKLPPGLYLDETGFETGMAGEIYGRADNSIPEIAEVYDDDGCLVTHAHTTYPFTVRAKSENFFENRFFSITVNDLHESVNTEVTIPIVTGFKNDWKDWLENIWKPGDLYRPRDEHFGLVLEPRLYMASSIRYDQDVIPDDLDDFSFDVSTIEDDFFNRLGPHTRSTRVYLGKIDFAHARNSKGEVSYDVVYMNIVDRQEHSSFGLHTLQTNIGFEGERLGLQDPKTDPSGFVYTKFIEGLEERTVDDSGNIVIEESSSSENRQIVATQYYGNSIYNMRQEILNAGLSISPEKERLPPWMCSEQIEGDSSSILGFTIAIPIAYMMPETAEKFINNLDESAKSRFLGREIDIDGYLFTVIR